MQAQRKGSGFRRTDTPGIYSRGKSYVAKWHEDGKARFRTFPTYEAAVAFRRDYILPYRRRECLPPSALAPHKVGGMGWVYAFQSRDGGERVKLGYSKDPAQRLSTLQCASPDKLDLMLLVPATPAVEGMLHTCLKDYRLRGEWYSREALHVVSAIFAHAVR